MLCISKKSQFISKLKLILRSLFAKYFSSVVYCFVVPSTLTWHFPSESFVSSKRNENSQSQSRNKKIFKLKYPRETKIHKVNQGIKKKYSNSNIQEKQKFTKSIKETKKLFELFRILILQRECFACNMGIELTIII